MPINESERERLSGIIVGALSELASTRVDEFVRPELGQLAFSELRPSIDALQSLARQLTETPIDALPAPLVKQAQASFAAIQHRLKELRDFDIVQISQRNQNPVQVRAQLIQNFDKVEAAFWDQITPVAAFLSAAKLANDPAITGATARAP